MSHVGFPNDGQQRQLPTCDADADDAMANAAAREFGLGCPLLLPAALLEGVEEGSCRLGILE